MAAANKPLEETTPMAFNEAAVRNNFNVLEYSRTCQSALTGIASGVLGLTGTYGFLFYLLGIVIQAAVWAFRSGSRWDVYFMSRSLIFNHSFIGGLFTYVLLWVFVYGLVHMVYRKFREYRQWGRYNTRYFKRLALRQQTVPMPNFQVPHALQAMGVTIHDPTAPGFFDAPIDPMYHSNHPQHRPPTDDEHPLYKSAVAFLYEGKRPFAEGVEQACTMINALTPRPFPEHICGAETLEWSRTLEEIVADAILAGESYDPSLEKLPLLHDPVLFWTRKTRWHGTPVPKRNNIILSNLYRKVFTTALRRDLLKSNCVDYDVPVSAIVTPEQFHEQQPLVIRHQPHLLVQRHEPLRLLADEAEVEATRSLRAPDIAPISPLMDLDATHIYNDGALLERQRVSGLNVDTIMFTKEQNQKYPFTAEELAANAIVLCFGAALAQSTRPGSDTRRVVAKAAQLVDGHLDLVMVQLNNINLTDSAGDKNLVWLEKDLPLYKTLPFVENMKTVEDVNVDTFKKFASMLLY